MLVVDLLLIAYLPTMYASFSRRETAVALLEVRAASPPSAVEMLARSNRIGWTDDLDSLWEQWEQWFADSARRHDQHRPRWSSDRSPPYRRVRILRLKPRQDRLRV